MTYEEAKALKSFKHYCTCGGFAAGSMNGRDPNDPHMRWCPQDEEYREYMAALASGPSSVITSVSSNTQQQEEKGMECLVD